ncbi:ATP-binding cassette domain-containing protein, partial [Bacillus cereus]|uniref:ATP-binding cassette domain-containing protein n=1 Tax=Bacillus cereus TaxID=1396 RepID=UPI00201BABFD
LDGIDLILKSGEVTANIGPSGSGKSTLLRCLNLLERPDDGIIEIGDAKVNDSSYWRKDVHKLGQQTAMVFQNYNLFKNKTALPNVTDALITAQKAPKKEAEQIGLD